MITVLITARNVEARVVLSEGPDADRVRDIAMRALAEANGFDVEISDVQGGGEEQPRTPPSTPEPRPLPEPPKPKRAYECDECDYVAPPESKYPAVSLAQHRRHRHAATPHPTQRARAPWPAKSEPLPGNGKVVAGGPIGKLPVGDIDAARARSAESAHRDLGASPPSITKGGMQ